jgi:hypothetical protein
MVGTVEIPDPVASRLRTWNWVPGGLHLAQAVVVVLLATSFALPVTATFMDGPPGSPPAETAQLFSVSVAWAVALFLLLSTLFHWLTAGPAFGRYRGQLSQGQNHFRWTEYSLSSSVMIVLIAMLTGISDIAALVALFGERTCG